MIFQKYVVFGGMPYLSNIRFEKTASIQYLHDLFNSVQLKDIVKRNNIRDVDLLERISAYVMANAGNTFSATSISKFFKSEKRNVAPDTILNYIKYCCDAYLFYQVKREDLQGKQILASNEKYYIADHGIREAVFGGNMGKPQKLENILSLAKKCLEYKDIKFLFVGNGSERERIEKLAKANSLLNVIFINYIPREEYEKLIASCYIGIVSLDERFTVPNFPSKTTDYFKLSLPIFASLDKCSAGDYGEFLQKKVKGGLFANADNIDELYSQFIRLYDNEKLRKNLGNNGRKYYEEYLGVDKAYNIIINKINFK